MFLLISSKNQQKNVVTILHVKQKLKVIFNKNLKTKKNQDI